MPTFLLRNANLLDLEAGSLRERTDVMVVDGKIAEVGEKLKAASADATYDLRGATLMPGLIDCHVHCWPRM